MASVEATAVPTGVAFVTVGSASPALVAVLASVETAGVVSLVLASLGAVCATAGVVVGAVTSSA